VVSPSATVAGDEWLGLLLAGQLLVAVLAATGVTADALPGRGVAVGRRSSAASDVVRRQWLSPG
jgi:hypothetical protein